jgi:(2Fe-2S) ferredoxin
MGKFDCGFQAGQGSFLSGLQQKIKSKLKNQKLDFQIEGRFLGFLAIAKSNSQFKYFRLHTSRGERTIKVAKPQRAVLGKTLVQGSWIEVSGEQKNNLVTGFTKYKATKVVVVNVARDSVSKDSVFRDLASKESLIQTQNLKPAPPSQKLLKPQATILVCQKSDCVKRGSGNVCKALAQALDDHNLSDRVQIKSTGCLKDCSAGPNLVVMPTKKRHRQVKPKHIPAIVAAISQQVTLKHEFAHH